MKEQVDLLIDELEDLGFNEKPFGLFMYISYENKDPEWIISIQNSEESTFRKIMELLGLDEDLFEEELSYLKGGQKLEDSLYDSIYTNLDLNLIKIWIMTPRKRDPRERVCEILPFHYNLPKLVSCGNKYFSDFDKILDDSI